MSLSKATQESIFHAFLHRSNRALRHSIGDGALPYLKCKRKRPPYRVNNYLPLTPLLTMNDECFSTVPIITIPTYKPRVVVSNTLPITEELVKGTQTTSTDFTTAPQRPITTTITEITTHKPTVAVSNTLPIKTESMKRTQTTSTDLTTAAPRHPITTTITEITTPKPTVAISNTRTATTAPITTESMKQTRITSTALPQQLDQYPTNATITKPIPAITTYRPTAVVSNTLPATMESRTTSTIPPQILDLANVTPQHPINTTTAPDREVTNTSATTNPDSQKLVRHIHPCVCDVSEKVLREVDERAVIQKRLHAELKRRLARVQHVIKEHRARHQQDMKAVKKDARSTSSGSEWSLFMAEGRTKRLRKTKVKVITKEDPSKTKKGRRKKFPSLLSPTKSQSSRRRIHRSARRSPGSSARKRLERKRDAKTTPKPKNPKVVAILNKLSPLKARSRVRGDVKLTLNWRKNPRIPVVDTRTSSMRKQSSAYCGRAKLKPLTDHTATPNASFKNTYPQLKIPVQQTRSSMLRIQAAINKRKLLLATKNALPTKAKAPFTVGNE